MYEIIQVLIQSIILLIIIYYYKKIKKYFITFSQKQYEQFILISKIENRISHPFKDFNNPNTNQHSWIVITSYNRKKKIERTIFSIKKHEPKVNVLVIDNGSDTETVKLLYALKNKNLIDKLLLNNKASIPQWQKSFSMAQAIKILSLDSVKNLL